MNGRAWTLLRRSLLALLLAIAGLVLLALLAAALLHGLHGEGLDIQIGGERWSPDGAFGHGTMTLVWLIGLLAVVLIGVPLVLLGALLSVVLSVGGLLLALALVLGIVLSPVIVLVALLWWLLRPRRPPSPTMHA